MNDKWNTEEPKLVVGPKTYEALIKYGIDQKTDPSLSHLVDSLSYLCWYLYPLVKKQENRTIRL